MKDAGSERTIQAYFEAEKRVLGVWCFVLALFVAIRAHRVPDADAVRESAWFTLTVLDYICLARVADEARKRAAGFVEPGSALRLVGFGSLKITCLVGIAVVLFRASFTMGIVLSGVSTLLIVPIISGVLARE